jgi:phosphatidylglycerophosphate synthase
MTSPTSRTPVPGSPGEAGPGPSGTPEGRTAAPVKPQEVEELVDELIHRPLARRVVSVLVRTPISPNQVTLISAVLGVSGGVAFALGAADRRWCLAAGLLLFLSVVFDCCDGQLARVRQISSTTGAILDGIADYAVGIAFALGSCYFMATRLESPWYWLLGLAGSGSTAVQSARFDHAKTRYVARVGGGYAEREEDVARVTRNRVQALADGRYGDAILFWVYEHYSRAQHAALAIPQVTNPSAYRAANAGRMRLWTFLGIGTHFALAYLACVLAFLWAPSAAVFHWICVTLLNVVLIAMIWLEARSVRT